MNIHFIAIGGAVMHNLAIALYKKGYKVTGSDDEIFDPAKCQLEKYGLLPSETGWFPEKISDTTDSVILGMHAKDDNPELQRAKELNIKIKSFPEFLFEQTRDKTRIVIGGSHGKTTITAMVMHVLKSCGVSFDYMVGSQIEGFETMVGLNSDSKIAVFEGDEYLTSALDRRPKFHLYHPDIAVINGIAWDHINVFPDWNDYVDQFRIFADMITEGGDLIYFADDSTVSEIAGSVREDIAKTAYRVHGYFQNSIGFFAATENRVIPLKIFGEHNMQNLSAAKAVCIKAGISEEMFYKAIQDFSGSSKRLQLINQGESGAVYLDFAHAPSKVKATVEAVCERYPDHRIVACFELHTFSSLSQDFLKQYNGTMAGAARSIVYFNPHAVKLKRLERVEVGSVVSAFGDKGVEVYDDSKKLINALKSERESGTIFLLMSSGDFNGTDIIDLSNELIS